MRKREARCEDEKEIQNTSCNSHFPGSRANFGRGFFIPRGRDRARVFRQSDLLSSTPACTYLAGKVYRHVKKTRIKICSCLSRKYVKKKTFFLLIENK